MKSYLVKYGQKVKVAAYYEASGSRAVRIRPGHGSQGNWKLKIGLSLAHQPPSEYGCCGLETNSDASRGQFEDRAYSDMAEEQQQLAKIER